MPDMNDLIRARVTPEEREQKRTSIETYRALSSLARQHEWGNLTNEDRQVALREGIQPAGVAQIGGRSDGGARSDANAGEKTDMNELLREAYEATFIERSSD